MKVGIVIPAYNESARLPKTLVDLSKAKYAEDEITDVVVVDDGSTDSTSSLVHAPFRSLRLERNRGKGAAVRAGIKASTAEWVLVADADQSTPWNQLARLTQAARQNPDARFLIGSRGLDASELTRRQSWIREHLGKAFNRFIVFWSGLPFKDTQCGFKLIHRPSVMPWLHELTVDRFAWDVELLLWAQAHQLRTIEVPVIWRHEEGSKVRVLRDGLRMLLDFLKIRVRLKLKSIKL